MDRLRRRRQSPRRHPWWPACPPSHLLARVKFVVVVDVVVFFSWFPPTFKVFFFCYPTPRSLSDGSRLPCDNKGTDFRDEGPDHAQSQSKSSLLVNLPRARLSLPPGAHAEMGCKCVREQEVWFYFTFIIKKKNKKTNKTRHPPKVPDNVSHRILLNLELQ